MVLASATCIMAFIPRGRHRSSSPSPLIVALSRDPALWFGGCFLVLLLIQWLNAGRELLFNWGTMHWLYAPPAISWLPGAVTRADAAEALRWFVPTWVIMLIIRHTLSRATLVSLYVGLVTSASALSLLAIIQWGVAQTELFGIPSPPDSYFATSFGYMNHAGAFCVLILAVSFGLFLRAFRINGSGTLSSRIFFGITSFILFVGAHVSESRAAICMVWLLALVALVLYIAQDWKAIPPVDRLNRLAIVCGIVGLLFFFVGGLGHTMLKREFVDELVKPPTSAQTQSSTVISAFIKAGAGGDRNLFRDIAVQIWKNHRWFGAGLWAQRYFMGIYLEPSEWSHVLDDGAANVHTDGLQFLSEFGLVGFFFMAMTVLAILRPIFNKMRVVPLTPDRLIIACGLMLILVYSFVDLPFRSPAILLTWTALLSGEAAFWKAKRPSS